MQCQQQSSHVLQGEFDDFVTRVCLNTHVISALADADHLPNRFRQETRDVTSTIEATNANPIVAQTNSNVSSCPQRVAHQIDDALRPKPTCSAAAVLAIIDLIPF
jgi:hypothetical protein